MEIESHARTQRNNKRAAPSAFTVNRPVSPDGRWDGSLDQRTALAQKLAKDASMAPSLVVAIAAD